MSPIINRMRGAMGSQMRSRPVAGTTRGVSPLDMAQSMPGPMAPSGGLGSMGQPAPSGLMNLPPPRNRVDKNRSVSEDVFPQSKSSRPPATSFNFGNSLNMIASRAGQAPTNAPFAKGGKIAKYAKGGKVGDPSKLSADKFSARAKRSTLRGDDAGTFMKGGMVKKAKGGKC